VIGNAERIREECKPLVEEEPISLLVVLKNLYVQYIQSYYNEYIQVEDITFTEIENLKGAELLNPLFYGAEEFLT